MQEFAGTARFELCRCLGQGGFGIVYEALDRERSARVALKLLRVADAAALYRFKREFRTLADVAHPNLVALDELFTDGHHWFFTMELVNGQPLVEYVRCVPRLAAAAEPLGISEAETETAVQPGASNVMPVPQRVVPGAVDEVKLRAAFAQLVAALVAIHRLGIVHRDIKPSNVLVTSEGRVVVLDFGLAAELTSDATPVGSLAGTPGYMAPEQALGQTPTPASDWYSVGVMLYEALTGRLPFTGTPFEIVLAKQQSPSIADAATVAVPELLTLSAALLDPNISRRPNGEEIMRRLKDDATVRLEALPHRPIPTASLIGRDMHLRALMGAFETASSGRSVIVFMPGHAGVGKSALIRQFVEKLRKRNPSAVVLSGRCHERESVPYKAVDGLVDQLARYLRGLSAIDVARLLPRDSALIARLFPVLMRVEEVERARTRAVAPLDSLELRRRASTALRELLSAISDRCSLVLTIDDLQWGDLDSASLLQEILRPPEPPPLLLLAAYRSEDMNAPLVRTLRDSLPHDVARRDVRTLEVEELTPGQAFELAVRELASRADIPHERATEIARESRGNSFFVHELVRHTLTVGGPVHLNTVIHERVGSLPADARQLLTAIALSAQPVIPAVATTATPGGDTYAAVRLLRAARLVRISDRIDGMEIETYHDRIRETIVEALNGPALHSWHARLAAAWEQSGAARPETLVAHFHGAGDRIRTAHYAALAAESAQQALAFDSAAQYYQLLLEVGDSERRSEWCTQLGDALANAGRGRDAAAAYREALTDAEPGMAIELERRAAEQLIRAGHLNEAREVLRSLLPKIGIRPARTDAGAFAGLVVRRLLLALRGTRVRERREHEIPADELQRIDTLWTIGAPLSLIELAHGNNLLLRGMWLVLRSGEPKRVVRALTALACSSAIAGTRHDARTQRFLSEAKRLAARIDDPTSTARTVLAEGICNKVNGRWVLAREHLERAIGLLMSCPGVRWEIETARTLLHDTLLWMGDWKRVFAELPARLQEADERGDLYSATHVTVRLAPIALLAADRPERARAEAIAGMARWPSAHFDLQHRFEVCSLIEADLYEGRAAEAWTRLRAAWPRLRWIRYAFQNARIEMHFYRARIALARASTGDLAYLRIAERDASRLERERAAWATALAALVRGSVRATTGGRDAAINGLLVAERALRDVAMAHYAAAAQYPAWPARWG